MHQKEVSSHSINSFTKLNIVVADKFPFHLIPHSEMRPAVNLVERNESPDNYQLLNAYRVGRHSSLDIVALAQEIQNADIAMHNQSGKLGLILDQIRFLQSQAHQILRDIKTNQSLHQAACNFKKVPGKTYYLYERASGQMYFSMLSPQVNADISILQE